MNAAFEELKASKKALISGFGAAGSVGSGFHREYARLMDQYFRRSLEESTAGRVLFRKKRPFALVAVGGYGREELCLHSDIDMFILFGGRIPQEAKQLAHELFFPLWDLGLDLGYGVRTIKDCLGLAAEDVGVLTSLLDMRFLCGESPLYLALAERLHTKVLEKKPTVFSQWLQDSHNARMRLFGDASHLLEPNLKEGIGGLRDYHHILWLSKVLFRFRIPRDLEYFGRLSHDEFEELQSALEFILLVRNQLHFLSGRRNDRLGFDHQTPIARATGFADRNGRMAVEQFLGRLHACMASLKTLHRSFIEAHVPPGRFGKKNPRRKRIGSGLHLFCDRIYFDTATDILKDPLLLARAFEQSAALDRPLSQEARRLVREFVFLVDDGYRITPEAVRLFLAVLRAGKHPKVLDEMFETGYLESFLPEFGAVKDRVQFDAYHTFPVGRHSLETVKNLGSLADQRDILLPMVFSELNDPEPLLLASLLHDVGKVGEDHAARGVGIARGILDRFAYDEIKSRDVLFLVGNHLLLAETATRRDLSDEKLVIQAARGIGSEDRLKMLYLLTWADSKATGPRAWNDWIANLVQELFFKVLHILQGGELATQDAAGRAAAIRSQIAAELSGRIGEPELEALLEKMPPRYLMNVSPADIVRHLGRLESMGEAFQTQGPAPFHLDADPEEAEACWKLTFMARDRPGLFSELAGVLSLNNINVLSADIYTWRDGTAVDLFRVTGPLDPVHPEETWQRVKRDLRDAFGAGFSLRRRLEEKARPAISLDPRKPSRPPKVTVDNRSSDFFTIVEVFADDRVGLLYDITRTLFEMRLDIRIAKIATKVDQSADAFYVLDLDGQKLGDISRVEALRAALIRRLSPRAETDRP